MSEAVPDLSNEADAALTVLAGASGGEGMVSARQDRSNTVVSTGPDVCLTPRGGGMVPVPYSSIAFMDTAIRLSTTVRNNGNLDFQLNSRCSTSTGMEPGTGKGVKIQGWKGMALAAIASDFVYSQGWATVSHGDPAWINRPGPGDEEPEKPMETSEI